MIHISQEELFKRIEREHNQRPSDSAKEELIDSTSFGIRDMSSDLSATCGKLRDRNNNNLSGNGDEDEVKAVLITGKSCKQT